MQKHLRTCAVEKCKKTGYTKRGYFLCGDHWNMIRFFAISGDDHCKYLLHHAGKGSQNANERAVARDLDKLEKELQEEGVLQ